MRSPLLLPALTLLASIAACTPRDRHDELALAEIHMTTSDLPIRTTDVVITPGTLDVLREPAARIWDDESDSDDLASTVSAPDQAKILGR